MYAIIADGPKQYKVAEGQLVEVELRAASPGDSIVFDKVLFYSGPDVVRVGKPHLPGARVMGTLVDQVKGQKVRVFKFRRRKDSKTMKGHRQRYSIVRIDSIECPAEEVPA